MGLATQFFDFLSLEHANNNVHNIRLCRQIVAAGAMPISVLVDMQVGDKVREWTSQLGTRHERAVLLRQELVMHVNLCLYQYV